MVEDCAMRLKATFLVSDREKIEKPTGPSYNP